MKKNDINIIVSAMALSCLMLSFMNPMLLAPGYMFTKLADGLRA